MTGSAIEDELKDNIFYKQTQEELKSAEFRRTKEYSQRLRAFIEFLGLEKHVSNFITENQQKNNTISTKDVNMFCISLIRTYEQENKIILPFNWQNGEYDPNKVKKIINNKKNEQLIEKLRKTLDYTSVLEDYIQDTPIYYDKSKIWWIWNKDRWELTDETDILNIIKDGLQITNIAKGSIKTEILESLKLVARKFNPIEPPKEWIQFKNKVINIETGDEEKVTPKYFFHNPIPRNISESDLTPNLDKIFSEWVCEDDIVKLYEFMAYCMLRDYPIHRLVCLVGSGRNGKSQYLKITEKFLGSYNCCSTELNVLLEQRFESFKLYKKLACFMSEANYDGIKNSALLKKLTGGDLIGFEKKGKDPFDERNYAKICISTNGIPITFDKSDGYYRRWLIIKFPNKFKEGKDIVESIPESEYDNLATKLLKVLRNLISKGSFHKEPSIEEKARIYEKESNPVLSFIDEFYERDVDGFTYKYEFKQDLTSYLKSRGYRVFTDRELNSIMEQEGYDTLRKGDKRWWAFVGFRKKLITNKEQKEQKVNNMNNLNNNSHSILYMGNQVENAVQPVHVVRNLTQPYTDIQKFILDTFLLNSVDYNLEYFIAFYPDYEESIRMFFDKLLQEGKIQRTRKGFYKRVD